LVQVDRVELLLLEELLEVLAQLAMLVDTAE
jgi:hypothetical protein